MRRLIGKILAYFLAPVLVEKDDLIVKQKRSLEIMNAKYSEVSDKSDELDKALEQFYLGADIYPHPGGGSWAVLCVNGKTPTVKFVNLPDDSLQILDSFLRSHDRYNQVHDLPHHLRGKIFKQR